MIFGQYAAGSGAHGHGLCRHHAVGLAFLATFRQHRHKIARALHLPLQLGENFDGPKALLQAIQAQACDLAMPDVARIGGVSGWMQAAGVAEAHGIPMSSHLMPEVSAHLLAATPTCHWLEYVDWTDAIAAEPVKIVDGHWPISDRPGTGLEWDAEKVARYRLD